MAALLAADGVAVLAHVFQHIAVAHGGLLGVDALALHILDEAQIGHDRHHSGIAIQTALFFHAHGQQGNDLVAVDLMAQLIAGQAAVRVAVKGNAAVKAALHNCLFQIVQMGAAHVLVDVGTVRRDANERALGAQPGKQLLCHSGRSAVGAVDADVQAGQIAVDRLIQVVHIVLQTVRPDRHPAHGGSGRQRDAGTVVVNVLLDLIFHISRQLVAGAGKNLDAVEFHRVVGGRDDNTGIRVVFLDQIGHSGGGQHAQALHVRAHAAQAGGQGRFQHIAGLAGILADEDAGAVAGAARQDSSSAAADLHGHLTGQVRARHTADAIRSKIFSHNQYLHILKHIPSPSYSWLSL